MLQDNEDKLKRALFKLSVSKYSKLELYNLLYNGPLPFPEAYEILNNIKTPKK